jgi:hypothetical protein
VPDALPIQEINRVCQARLPVVKNVVIGQAKNESLIKQINDIGRAPVVEELILSGTRLCGDRCL